MAENRIVGYVPPPGCQEATRLLRLKVIAGHNLAKKDIFGASDPYLRIDLVSSTDGEEVEDSVLTKTKKRTLNPKWEEEFIFRVRPTVHKLVLEVFDENRLTRDDFLGMVELPLNNMPREAEGRNIPNKYYILRPRSARSKVKGHLQLYHAFVADSENPETEADARIEEIEIENPISNEIQSGHRGRNNDEWEIVGNVEDPAHVSDMPPMASNDSVTDARNPNVRSTNQHFNERSTDDSNPSLAGGQVLPAGWEERQDANGRTYFVNHVARSTQWHHPASNEANPTESVSPGSEASNAGLIESRRRVHISMDDSRPEPLPNQRNRLNSDSVIEHLHNLSVDSSDVTDAPPPVPSSQRRSSSVSSTPSSGGERNSSYGGAVPRRTSVSTSQPASGPANPKLNTEGLPPDWTMQVAPNGRVFFINHTEKKTSWVDPRSGRPSALPSQNNIPNRPHEDDLGPLPEGWEERVHTDARIFFIDHNTRTTQWEDPRISTIGGPAIPYNRDYKRKYDYLKSQLKKPGNVPNKFEIKVRRQHILEDSYRQIQFPSHKVDILKTKLWIEFDSEIGLDYGGLAREWFYLLSKEMFNPYYGLFEYSATDNYTLQINPYSGVCNEEHLNYFKFIGRIAGMAVYHGKLLDGFFIRPFYKMMLSKTIVLKDMESVDTEYFNSLMWIKENDPAELELTFQVDEEQFGKTITRELKEDGAKIPVTNDNKDEYINHVIQWRFVSRVEDQMNAFKAGFNDLVNLSS